MTRAKPKLTRHFIARSTIEPGKPDRWRALCGYESAAEKEFTITGSITCAACVAKMGRVVEPVLQWRLK